MSKKGRGREVKKSGISFWNNSRHSHFQFHHCYLNLKQTKNTEWNFTNVDKKYTWSLETKQNLQNLWNEKKSYILHFDGT